MKKQITIPKNLDEAIIILKDFLSSEDFAAILKFKSDNDMAIFHHSLGRFLRNEWKLWYETPIVEYFNSLGIRHADDMSGIILTSLWREMHGQPILLDEQIKHYQDFWNKNL